MVRITALMDNMPSEHRLLTNEHGLSYLLESPDFRILFDCGATFHSCENAHRLGLDLNNLDAVVLSHSHYDHAAGYRDLIEAGLGSSLLYVGSHFFEPKYAFDGLRYTDLSAGFDRAFLQEHGIICQENPGLKEIAKDLFIVTNFPRLHAFETIPARFVRQSEIGFIADDFADEQCLVLKQNGQLYVFVGCSHPGILNMITQVHKLLNLPVAAVFGGTHLVEANPDRIEKTVEAMKAMGLQTIGLSHCSGEAAEQIARSHEGVKACHLACGDSIFIG